MLLKQIWKHPWKVEGLGGGDEKMWLKRCTMGGKVRSRKAERLLEPVVGSGGSWKWSL